MLGVGGLEVQRHRRARLVALGVGAIGGAAVGLVMARKVKMTDVPQVVSIFNAVGGGAAALVATADFVRLDGGPGIGTRVMIATVLDIIVGPVTFSGSLIAAGKLQGWVPSRPVVFPGARFITSATACADSSAGIIPSVRASKVVASSASASDTGTYSALPASRKAACSGPIEG